MRSFADYCTIVQTKTADDGSLQPVIPEGAAFTAGGSWTAPDGKVYLLGRLRMPVPLPPPTPPEGLAYSGRPEVRNAGGEVVTPRERPEEEFRRLKPSLWAKYQMSPRVVTVDGKPVTVTPQVPVWLGDAP